MSYFSATKLRRLRQMSRMSLTDVYKRTGVSRAQVSRIENGLTDPRMSTVTRLLTCYGATLGDVEAAAPTTMTLGEIRDRSQRGAARLARSGLGASDPIARLDRKASMQLDVSAEQEALATRT